MPAWIKTPVRLKDFLCFKIMEDHSNFLVFINRNANKCGENDHGDDNFWLYYDAYVTEHVQPSNVPENGLNLLKNGDYVLAFDDSGTLKEWEVIEALNSFKCSVTNGPLRKDTVIGQLLTLKEAFSYEGPIQQGMVDELNETHIQYVSERYDMLGQYNVIQYIDENGNVVKTKVIP